MSAQQQVITIDDISADNAPAIYVAGGLSPFFEKVKAEVASEVPDLKTAKGRARIASLAATVSKSKAAVEKPGRDHLKRLKEMPKVVEAELREFVNKMDDLRDTTRQPLTDWENAEQARKDRHVDNIQAIKDMEVFGATPPASVVARVIADLEAMELGDSWEEFLPEAAQAKDRTLSLLRAIHAQRIQHEAEQAELVRLRAEAEAQAQRDRDAAIAQAAADQARREEAERAEAERLAAARREQDLLDQAAAAQRAAAQAALDAEAAAERQRLQLQLQAEQAERQTAQAKADKLAAEQRAEQDRLTAIRRQEEAVEQARLAEKARADAAADEILRQEKLREADKTHKGKIYKAAKEAFIEHGMTEDCARLAVKLVASGLIPAMSIQY